MISMIDLVAIIVIPRKTLQKEFDKEYKFFPRTFILPFEYGEFKQTFVNKAPNNRPVYIVKPEAGC